MEGEETGNTAGRICTHAVKWKIVRKAVDVQEAKADQGASAPWTRTRGNNCPLVEKIPHLGSGLSDNGAPEPLPDLQSMSRKELRDLNARLRLLKLKRHKGYKQEITELQQVQLVQELNIRGFATSENEVDLLLRGGSIPSGAGMCLFYRNQRLQEDDKWREWYP